MQENSKKVYKYGVCVEDFNNEHWEFVRNLTKFEQENRGKRGSAGAYGFYGCKHCGKILHRQKQAFKNKLFICPNECNGVKYGNGAVVLKGINDLATTYPRLVKYLTDRGDGYKYTAHSMQKAWVKCPECKSVKKMIIDNLTKRGFSCSICSDGVSYPEKFVGGLLKQLGVEFKKEISLDGGKTRYDFYLPDHNCIIETHGIQHYEQTRRKGARTVEEEQTNDRYKYELAMQNKIEHYISLDARESNLEWMMQSILNSCLPVLLNIEETEIDWNDIANNCEISMVKEVCNYFNEFGGTTTSIAKIFNIHPTTVWNYLTRGTQLGWCDYTDDIKKQNQREANRQTGLNSGKKVRGTHLKTNKISTFTSATEASKWLFQHGLTLSKRAYTNISACCLGKRKSAYGYKWEYIDDIEEINQNT